MHYEYILNKEQAYDFRKDDEVGESYVPVL